MFRLRSTSSTRILHLNILYPNPSSQHPLPESFISTSSTRILHLNILYPNPSSQHPLPESFISTSSTRILHLNILYPNPSSQHPLPESFISTSSTRILHLPIQTLLIIRLNGPPKDNSQKTGPITQATTVKLAIRLMLRHCAPHIKYLLQLLLSSCEQQESRGDE
ncbi:hypothetical protein RRG08_050600, partial [Elysia crispata]